MIKVVILASYGYYGGAIGDMLSKWEQMGFFSYLLPFLLIFAIVFGILSSMKLFRENRAVDAIIAFAVALLSLQFEFVPVFFSEIFPRMGVGLAVLLVILIIAGFFVDPTKPGIMYALLGIGVIIAVVILVTTSESVGWSSGYWWAQNWEMLAGVVFVLVALAVIIGVSNKKTPTPYALPVWRPEGS